MYIPDSFVQENPDDLLGLIAQYPFATLVSQSGAGIEAMHLPLILSLDAGKRYLKGHIAKANALWKSIPEGAAVLAVFNGPDCYVSPNYYPTKEENGRAVPTWNYAVVHVKGAISFVHDAGWIHNLVEELTALHESAQPQPWSINDAPEAYIQRLLSAVVGIQIEVHSITGKWKLSQNQPEANQRGVVQGLRASNDRGAMAIASMIADRLDQVSGVKIEST